MGSPAVMIAPVVSDSELRPAGGPYPSDVPGGGGVIAGHGYRGPGGPPGGNFENGLHVGARTIHGPCIHVVDPLKMVHVSDNDRVNILQGELSFLQGSGDRLMDQFHAVHIQARALVKSLSGTDDSDSLAHKSSSKVPKMP